MPNWTGNQVEEFSQKFLEGTQHRSEHVFISDETVVSEADDDLLREAFTDAVDTELVADLVEEQLDGSTIEIEIDMNDAG